MTKKEKQQLKSKRCVMERESGQFLVSFCMTQGELLALKNALAAWQTPVGMDVDESLSRAARDIGFDL
jgi:hypothetical protein